MTHRILSNSGPQRVSWLVVYTTAAMALLFVLQVVVITWVITRNPVPPKNTRARQLLVLPTGQALLDKETLLIAMQEICSQRVGGEMGAKAVTAKPTDPVAEQRNPVPDPLQGLEFAERDAGLPGESNRIRAENESLAKQSPPIASRVGQKGKPPRDQGASLPLKEQNENKDNCAADGSCGTSVRFARSPSEAARQAREERKLLFVVHLSGNFEEKQFT